MNVITKVLRPKSSSTIPVVNPVSVEETLNLEMGNCQMARKSQKRVLLQRGDCHHTYCIVHCCFGQWHRWPLLFSLLLLLVLRQEMCLAHQQLGLLCVPEMVDRMATSDVLGGLALAPGDRNRRQGLKRFCHSLRWADNKTTVIESLPHLTICILTCQHLRHPGPNLQSVVWTRPVLPAQSRSWRTGQCPAPHPICRPLDQLYHQTVEKLLFISYQVSDLQGDQKVN